MDTEQGICFGEGNEDSVGADDQTVLGVANLNFPKGALLDSPHQTC